MESLDKLVIETHELFLCGCYASHLLNAQSLESYNTTRSQLISIVTNAQLPVSIVAPAVHLDRHTTTPFTVQDSWLSLQPVKLGM